MTHPSESSNKGNQEQNLLNLVSELDAMPRHTDKKGSPQPIKDHKARTERIYQDFDTKESILEAIKKLEKMKAELEKEVLAKRTANSEQIQIDLSAINEAIKPLRTAMESLKNLPPANPAVEGISKQIHILETQKAELQVKLEQLKQLEPLKKRIAVLESAMKDFTGVIEYFERKKETIAYFDHRYSEISDEAGLPLPVDPNDRQKALLYQRKVAKKIHKTLRGLDIIEEPGRGKLNKDETIRDRTEAFFGTEEPGENEKLMLKPDSREETMTLWYAGLEPNSENLRKIRSFFKTPVYLGIRSSAIEQLKKVKAKKNLKAKLHGLQNLLAQLFSVNNDPAKIHDLNKKINEYLSDMEWLMNIDYVEKQWSEAYSCAQYAENAKRHSPENSEKNTINGKKALAEALPDIAVQIADGSFKIERLNQINFPNFISFNYNDGPTITEDIPGFGGKDMINQLARKEYHKAKKVRDMQESETRRLDERQATIDGEVKTMDDRIRTMIAAFYKKNNEHNLFGGKISEIEKLNKERSKEIDSAQGSITSLIQRGVELPKDWVPDDLPKFVTIAKTKSESLKKKLFVTKKIESDIFLIDRDVNLLSMNHITITKIDESIKRDVGANQNWLSNALAEIKKMRIELIAMIQNIKEQVDKRLAIQPAEGRSVSNFDNQPSGHTSGYNELDMQSAMVEINSLLEWFKKRV